MAHHSNEYINKLKKLIEEASPLAIEICNVRHSHFGEPGWGGVDFVTGELYWAEKIVQHLKSIRLLSQFDQEERNS